MSGVDHWRQVAKGPDLFGRTSELAHLERQILRPSVGAVVILEGPPGIGKTALWRALAETARQRSWPVLATRCSPSESDLTFSALGDLIEPVLARIQGALPEPRARSLRVALRLETAGDRAPDRLALGRATVSVLEAVGSADRPALLAVDDVQWMDRESLGTLRFAVRRAVEHGFRILLTRRTGEFAPHGSLLSEIEAHSARFSLGPLSVGAVYDMIRDQLHMTLSRSALTEIYRSCGGNPLFALELARAVRDGQVQVSPGLPLPVPDSLQAAIGRRVERLPAGALQILAVAALSATPSTALLHEAIVDPDVVDDALVLAEREAVATVEANDTIVFSHPLLQSAIVGTLTSIEQKRVHRRLAEVLPPGEERARHRAKSTTQPDEVTARDLELAAKGATARGVPAVGAELAELAYRYTPSDNGRRALLRLLTAVDAALTAGDADLAERLVREALVREHEGSDHAEILLRAFKIEPSVDGQLERLREALECAPDDSSVRARALQGLASATWRAGSWLQARQHANNAVQTALRTEDPELIVAAVGTLTALELGGGRLPDRSLLDQALALEDRVSCDSYELPSFAMGAYHFARGELDAARPLMESAWARSQRRDETNGILIHLAELDVRAGRLEAAYGRGKDVLRLMEQSQDPQIGAALFALSLAEAHLGMIDRAREHAESGLVSSQKMSDMIFTAQNQFVLAFIGLSVGDAAGAMTYIDPLAELCNELVRDPGVCPFHPIAVEAALLLGHHEQAGRFSRELSEVAEALDHPWGRAAAARCEALVWAGAGDWERALDAADRALRLHQTLPMPFERGRALLVAGQVKRRARQKRSARDALTTAAALFEGLGAPLWQSKAEQELARIGGRAASSAALTHTEARVADLVVAGDTNQQVADTLFISISTVETNLTRIYRKLGVTSRTQLAARLQDHRPAD